MQHRQHRLHQLFVEGIAVDTRLADLVIVTHDGNPEPDWELVAHTTSTMRLERRAYQLDMLTTEGKRLCGDALLVRAVETALVFRGAGPLSTATTGSR